VRETDRARAVKVAGSWLTSTVLCQMRLRAVVSQTRSTPTSSITRMLSPQTSLLQPWSAVESDFANCIFSPQNHNRSIAAARAACALAMAWSAASTASNAARYSASRGSCGGASYGGQNSGGGSPNCPPPSADAVYASAAGSFFGCFMPTSKSTPPTPLVSLHRLAKSRLPVEERPASRHLKIPAFAPVLYPDHPYGTQPPSSRRQPYGNVASDAQPRKPLVTSCLPAPDLERKQRRSTS